ncbi:DNA-binding protein [Clostridium sporogenes]|uniref:DNA-binding protein n=1 Tax=Clostridium sporogenes TaxID=1509 RepID=A0AAE4FN88_CLOSG|nr:DNA-binding protein [Clostridium sporogenes]MDS1004482.1 DNA-binding protein [Clostridium sporogenes]
MLKSKSWILWGIGAICLIAVGIMRLIDKKYLNGGIFIALGVLYIVFSIINYKFTIKANETILSDEELEKINNELRELIKENKTTEAIKKYRTATGEDLIKAKEYVDSLMKEETK